MPICNPCTKLRSLNFCNPAFDEEEENYNTIEIGHTVDNPGCSDPFFAYFRSLATGQLYVFPVNCTPTENNFTGFSLIFANNFPLDTGQDYEFWVGHEGDGLDDAVDIVINDPSLSGVGCITASCFTINSERVYDLEEGGFLVSSDSQSLKCL